MLVYDHYMIKVLISSNRVNLYNFLKDSSVKYFYLSPYPYHIDTEKFLEGKKYVKIDINEGIGDVDFKKEYVDFIGRLNLEYKSLYWWANTISYKGTFVSRLCEDIFNYYCIAQLVARGDYSYIIVSDNAILNNYIERYCIKKGIECKLLDAQKKENRIIGFKRCFMSSVYFLCEGWMRKILTSIVLARDIEKNIKKRKSYHIIKSWVSYKSFVEGGYRDLYFGKLPEYLKQKDKEFLVLAGILTDYRNVISGIKRIKDYPIIPQEYFVGYFDYLKVITLNFINRPRITKSVLFCGLDMTDFIKYCLRKDYEYNEANKNLIYYYYVKGLLRKIKVSKFIFTFENQSWERMSILALRKYSPETKIIGYAHSSFRPYLVGYLCSKEEKDCIPLPDKIVTVGKAFKMILEEYGNYNDKVELSDGCALRFEYLFKKEKIKWNRDGNILVALSMDIVYSLKMLKFLCDAFSGNSMHKVVIRSHPFTPAEDMINKYDMKLASNFKISKNLAFKEDLANASVVIYADTTSSMEAVMCGVPVIHLDLKEPISLDPLFRLNNLKWTVSTKQEMYKAMDCIYKIGKDEYLREYSKVLIYLESYFNPVEDKYLKEFITA